MSMSEFERRVREVVLQHWKPGVATCSDDAIIGEIASSLCGRSLPAATQAERDAIEAIVSLDPSERWLEQVGALIQLRDAVRREREPKPRYWLEAETGMIRDRKTGCLLSALDAMNALNAAEEKR